MLVSLEHSALHWLHWEKKCHAVLHERSPRPWGLPDVLGILQSRHLIEVEIKRSVSDFKANAKKRHVLYRGTMIKKAPKYFYFFVPSEIRARVEPLVPEWAGLAVDDGGFKIVKESPVNGESQKLSTKECCKLFHLMSNMLYSQSQTIAGHENRWQWHNEPWVWHPEI